MLLPNHLYFLGEGVNPRVEIMDGPDVTLDVVLLRTGEGRHGDESLWRADLNGHLPEGEWQFRIDCGNGHYIHPTVADSHTTGFHTLWVQDGELFDYRPEPELSEPRVVKIEAFEGCLPTRPLYIGLPRGFDQHSQRRYPVIYMHDGQNCFEEYVADSYIGSWQADLASEYLISHGLMQECIVAGVGNGQEDRVMEYLPPYARFLGPTRRPHIRTLDPSATLKHHPRPRRPQPGQADITALYYEQDVAAYLERNYRAAPGREQRATCGSSMGGLFSFYLAWDQETFARHHAALSTSFWITRNRQGKLETVERIRTPAAAGHSPLAGQRHAQLARPRRRRHARHAESL